MPAWSDLVTQFDAQPDADKLKWLQENYLHYLQAISKLREGKNVLYYGSAFFQKPSASPALLQITYEDINGFMTTVNGMDCSKGLTLIMHTPGGVTNATETIVSYLRSKFADIEVIIPAMAMSAGTMISLSADRIIMGKQSQLGPIDPQMPINGRFMSAIAIQDQFEKAKSEIIANRQNVNVWAPILSTLGPALLQEAENAIEHSEKIVADWLEKNMFEGHATPKEKAKEVATHFSRGSIDINNKSHGRRIDRVEALGQGIIIEELEANQEFQDAVLTAYHLMTIFFEKTLAVKMIYSNHNRHWIKNG